MSDFTEEENSSNDKSCFTRAYQWRTTREKWEIQNTFPQVVNQWRVGIGPCNDCEQVIKDYGKHNFKSSWWFLLLQTSFWYQDKVQEVQQSRGRILGRFKKLDRW